MSDCAQCLSHYLSLSSSRRSTHTPLRQGYHGPNTVDGSALFAFLVCFFFNSCSLLCRNLVVCISQPSSSLPASSYAYKARATRRVAPAHRNCLDGAFPPS